MIIHGKISTLDRIWYVIEGLRNFVLRVIYNVAQAVFPLVLIATLGVVMMVNSLLAPTSAPQATSTVIIPKTTPSDQWSALMVKDHPADKGWVITSIVPVASSGDYVAIMTRYVTQAERTESFGTAAPQLMYVWLLLTATIALAAFLWTVSTYKDGRAPLQASKNNGCSMNEISRNTP